MQPRAVFVSFHVELDLRYLELEAGHGNIHGGVTQVRVGIGSARKLSKLEGDLE